MLSKNALDNLESFDDWKQWFEDNNLSYDKVLTDEELAKLLTDREFHNVNCRFCGAIHDVDWANISVLSQVIHSVNERKMVQTNMISFVSHGDKTLQRLVGMPGEQEHHISSVPFFFS